MSPGQLFKAGCVPGPVPPSSKPPVALVTGANSGIGFETARGLAARGRHVVLACRSLERGETARNALRHENPRASLEVMEVDIGDPASISSFAKAYMNHHSSLEILVNNAGVIPARRRETAEGFEETFAVNHLGPFRLTHALLPALRAAATGDHAPPRVVTLSSLAHRGARVDWSDLQMSRRFVPWRQYCNTKLYNLWFSDVLAERLHGDGIVCHAVHPGSGTSDLWREFPAPLQAGIKAFMKSTETLARTSIQVATDDRFAAETGGYWHQGRPARRSRLGKDDVAAVKMWRITEAIA